MSQYSIVSPQWHNCELTSDIDQKSRENSVPVMLSHCLMSYPSPEPILNACSLLCLYGVRRRIVYASSLDARSTVDWEWIPTTRGSWATNSPCPSFKLCNYKAYYYYYPQDGQHQRNSKRASQAARNPKIRGKSPGTSQSLKASRPANPPPRYGDAMAGGTCNV